MLSPEIKALARAVLADDEAAAMMLFDAIGEVRGRFEDRADEQEVLWRLVFYGLGRRVRLALARLRIGSLPELLAKRPVDLMEAYSFGPRSLQLVRDALRGHALHLRGDSLAHDIDWDAINRPD